MNKLAVGIDIGGTNTSIGLIDREGKVLYEHAIATQTREHFEDFVADMYREITVGIQQLNEPCHIVGIGIGAPNANYYSGCIENAANLRWKGIINVVALFKKHLDVPVFLTNDANAAAIGEMIYGGAKQMKDFIVVTLGTGLGSGIVVNGKLLYGHDGFAGEMGHMIVERNGRLCGCGRNGCLETYVSATGLVRTAAEQLANYNKTSSLNAIPFNQLTSKQVADAANAGDEVAKAAVLKTAKILGEALADVSVISSPKAIFLFGGLTKAGAMLIDEVKHHMGKNMVYLFKDKIQLLISELGDNAAIMGASALVWAELENQQ
jgi:glucokinase